MKVFPPFSREFFVELREDPSSVFAADIVIENTNGPIDYDLSRVYTGKLEGEFYYINECLSLLTFIIFHMVSFNF